MTEGPDAAHLGDRLRGCLLGGALGDSLGGPHEGRIGPLVVEPWRPGPLSDDTQLTLATCEAIGPGGVVSPEEVAQSFLSWFRARRITGMGASTLKALRDLDAGAHWSLAGREGERAAGNGAAMRVAPLAFCLDVAEDEDRRTLRDVCRITHRNDEAYVGALAIVRSVQAGLEPRRRDLRDLTRDVAATLPDTRVRDGLQRAGELRHDLPMPEAAEALGCSGFVAESVPLALFAAQRGTLDGWDALFREVISVGGDTDTIASMVGQVLGAWFGAASLPPELLALLPERDDVEERARHLRDRLGLTG